MKPSVFEIMALIHIRCVQFLIRLCFKVPYVMPVADIFLLSCEKGYPMSWLHPIKICCKPVEFC